MKGLLKYVFASALFFGCEADEREYLKFESPPVHLVKDVSPSWSITGDAKYCTKDSYVKIFVHAHIQDDKGVKEAGIAFNEEFSNNKFVLAGTCDRIFPNAIYHEEKKFIADVEDVWFFYENCSGEKHGIKLEEVDCDSINN